MYLCDSCAAQLVLNGRMKPLTKMWGVNNVPWKKGRCEKCNKEDDYLSLCPDYEIKPEMINSKQEEVLK